MDIKFCFTSGSLIVLAIFASGSLGATVSDDAVSKYQELRLNHQHRYVIYKLVAGQIVVDKVGSRGATYAEFLSNLPETECRYAAYDFEYKSEDNGDRNKYVYFLWVADDAKIRSKMEYTGASGDLKKKLIGINTEIQGTDKQEVSYATVYHRVTGRNP